MTAKLQRPTTTSAAANTCTGHPNLQLVVLSRSEDNAACMWLWKLRRRRKIKMAITGYETASEIDRRVPIRKWVNWDSHSNRPKLRVD